MITTISNNEPLTEGVRNYLVSRGAEMSRLRRKARISQKDMATLLGTTKYIIGNVERGRQRKEDIIDSYVAICDKRIGKETKGWQSIKTSCNAETLTETELLEKFVDRLLDHYPHSYSIRRTIIKEFNKTIGELK